MIMLNHDDSKPNITDEVILDLIRSEIIICDFNNLDVRKLHRRRRTYKSLSKNRHPLSGRIRIVLGLNDGRRLIYRNRLIWMAYHDQLIPDGCKIDHKNGIVEDDRPENLQLHTAYESNFQGQEMQLDVHYQSWQDFLNYIAFTGHEPPPDSPLWK